MKNVTLVCNISQIVHGTEAHMAVYGPGCHTQNIIWTEAKCRELFVTLCFASTNKPNFLPK